MSSFVPVPDYPVNEAATVAATDITSLFKEE